MARAKTKQRAPEVPALKARRDLTPVWRKISDLKPDPRNARTHTIEQVRQVEASIRQFGWTVPILIDPHDVIIAGHARLEAASLIGHEEVPTVVLADLTPAERRAYAIADNRLPENSGWDWDVLRAEMGDLKGLGMDLTMTGFTLPDIAELLKPQTVNPQRRSELKPGTKQYRCPKCNHEWAGKPK